jgi:hypothetical protein
VLPKHWYPSTKLCRIKSQVINNCLSMSVSDYEHKFQHATSEAESESMQ